MDGNRFDQITRALVTSDSRRGLLKGAVATLAGLAAMRAHAGDASCRPGDSYCQRHTDCCSGECYLASRNRFKRVCATNCEPLSCDAFGGLCGAHDDGCGGETSCPCPRGRVCLSNGTCALPCLDGTCPTCGECREDVDTGLDVCSEGETPNPCTNTDPDCPAGTHCPAGDDVCHPTC